MKREELSDIAKQQIVNEIKPVSTAIEDMMTKLQTGSWDPVEFNKHMLYLGVYEDSMTNDRLTDVVGQILGFVTGRMYSAGLDRTAMTQILHHAWNGTSGYMLEFAWGKPGVISANACDQIVRLMRVALDELVPICGIRENVPKVAWMLMDISIAISEASMLPSRCEQTTS